MKEERKQKIIDAYAHDYRDMNLSESALGDVLSQAILALECEHQCTSECRRSGCNCSCGEYHL